MPVTTNVVISCVAVNILYVQPPSSPQLPKRQQRSKSGKRTSVSQKPGVKPLAEGRSASKTDVKKGNLRYCSSCYPHMPIGKVWIYRLLFVCVLCLVRVFCVSVRLRMSLPRIKLAVSHFARRFIVVQGPLGISHFCELCSPRSPKSDD